MEDARWVQVYIALGWLDWVEDSPNLGEGDWARAAGDILDGLGAFESLRVEHSRYEEALRQVSAIGHPEWCSWSCFGGDEIKVCDCWVVPVRRALVPVEVV